MSDEKRKKFIHIGAPACFSLELAMQHVNDAFDCHGSYVVGSVLERADWRDVDIRMILDDDAFSRLFPDAGKHWEFDQRWLLLTVSISAWLKQQTGLPIDFQFQPRTHANAHHEGPRNAVGLRFSKSPDLTDGC